MPLKLSIKPKFVKKLKKLNLSDQIKIKNAIKAFVNNAGDFDVIRIKKDLWRLKTGKWRVFFTFVKDIVTLLTVERRKSKTYKKS